MRILMLCYEFPPLGGGGSRVVSGLSEELVRLGHTVDVVTMGFRGLPRHEQVNGVQVNRVHCFRREQSVCTVPEAASYVVSAIPMVWRLVKHNPYDLVHGHFIFPDGLVAWLVNKGTGLPYVITAHGSDVPGYNPHRLRLVHKLLAPLWRRVVRRAAQVVCPSNTLESLVAQQSQDVKRVVIPNGIDVNKFHPNGRQKPHILMVTRILERKGVQYVLKALEGFPLDHEVNIVGDGPYLSALRQMTQKTGIPVKFWGWLDNRSPLLKELFETSSIFILCSESENFPVVLLEAMAAGLAIITTQSTGCAEVVGDTGLLVQPRDPEAIKGALRQLIRDDGLRQSLGQAARKRLVRNFSWGVVGGQYVHLYRNYATGQRDKEEVGTTWIKIPRRGFR